MENILEQLSSSSIDQHLSSLERILNSPDPLPRPFCKKLIRSLKRLLILPNSSTFPSILSVLSRLFLQDQSNQYFLDLTPTLLQSLTNAELQAFLPQVVSLITDTAARLSSLRPLGQFLLELGLRSETPEVKLAALQIIKTVYSSSPMSEDLQQELRLLKAHPLDSLRTAACSIVDQPRSPVKSRKSTSECAFRSVPNKIIDRIVQALNWRDKLAALQALEEYLNSLDSLASLYFELPAFLAFLCDFLSDPSFKVALTTVSLLGMLVSAPETSAHTGIMSILTFCIKKLGDNKISVRLAVHGLFRVLVKIDPGRVVEELVKALEDCSWHIREEVVMVLIAAMLMKVAKFEYLSLASSFARLLDDPRVKIRVASTEALAVLANLYGQQPVVKELEEIVDSTAFQAITARFRMNTLPLLNDEYVIFPKELPQACRVISSPYLSTSPFEVYSERTIVKSASFEKSHNETPTTAETSTEPKILRKNLTASNLNPSSSRSVQLLKKDSLFESVQNDGESISYTPFEMLGPVTCSPEALQRSIFHSEGWSEQFETVNLIRRLVKYNPEVFLSKVTLHNIVLNLAKWADSLRSSLSKNALIALKEMCEHIGKAIDGEIPDILKIFLKKASDTNTFLSETATLGLDSLCLNCTEAKVLIQLVLLAENARNPLIKSKIMHCLSKIIAKSRTDILKMKDLHKAIHYISEYLSDASPEVRKSAKQAFDILVEIIPNEGHINAMAIQGVKENVLRRVKDAIKKKPKPHSVSSISFSNKRQDLRVTLPALVKNQAKPMSISAREIPPSVVPTESEEILKKVEQAEAGILDMEWKVRYDAISTAVDIIKNQHRVLVASNKLGNLLHVMEKGLTDSNLKVLVHSLTYLVKLIPLLSSRSDGYLGHVLEPLVVSLGSSNTSIRDVAWDACILVSLHSKMEGFLPLLANCIAKTSPRGKAAVITLMVNSVNSVKDMAMLTNCMLPVAYKFVDNSRVDIRNEAGRLLGALYRVLGNQVLDSAPTSKLHKVIALITKELD